MYPAISKEAITLIKVVRFAVNFSITNNCWMMWVRRIKVPGLTIWSGIPTLNCRARCIYIVPSLVIFNPLTCRKSSIFSVIMGLTIFYLPARNFRCFFSNVRSFSGIFWFCRIFCFCRSFWFDRSFSFIDVIGFCRRSRSISYIITLII